MQTVRNTYVMVSVLFPVYIGVCSFHCNHVTNQYKGIDQMSEGSHSSSAIAGFFSGASSIIFYPLEMAKVRLIVSDSFSKNHIPKYRSSLEVFRTMVSQQGFLSLYKGCHVNLFSNLSWMTYFYFYSVAKSSYSDGFKEEHPHAFRFGAAFQAAFLSRLISNPLRVIKTRLMLQHQSENWVQDTIEAIKKIYIVDGARGYWAGLGPGLVLSANGGLQLYTYETLKDWLGSDANWKVMLAGAVSKVVSTSLLFPVLAVMIKLQQEQYSTLILNTTANLNVAVKGEKMFRGITHCLEESFRNDGIRGLYRGLPIHLCRVIPSSGLFFLVYEKVISALEANPPS